MSAEMLDWLLLGDDSALIPPSFGGGGGVFDELDGARVWADARAPHEHATAGAAGMWGGSAAGVLLQHWPAVSLVPPSAAARQPPGHAQHAAFEHQKCLDRTHEQPCGLCAPEQRPPPP